jgi:hypothetical protein
MSESIKQTGSCLCGAVSFTAKNPGKRVEVCHCGMCRRWGGGPFMEIDCGTEISFSGEENIEVFDSSAWAERGFCRNCGSHLFYRLKEINQHQVPVGLFDNQEGLVFECQVFIDRKPSFYSFSNKTKNLTEAEIVEMHSPPTS